MTTIAPLVRPQHSAQFTANTTEINLIHKRVPFGSVCQNFKGSLANFPNNLEENRGICWKGIGDLGDVKLFEHPLDCEFSAQKRQGQCQLEMVDGGFLCESL